MALLCSLVSSRARSPPGPGTGARTGPARTGERRPRRLGRGGEGGEAALHHREERVDVPDEVIGLTLGDRMAEPGLRRCPFGGTGGEEGGPLPQFRSDLTEEYPGTAWPATPTFGTGPRGQYGCGC